MEVISKWISEFGYLYLEDSYENSESKPLESDISMFKGDKPWVTGCQGRSVQIEGSYDVDHGEKKSQGLPHHFTAGCPTRQP